MNAITLSFGLAAAMVFTGCSDTQPPEPTPAPGQAETQPEFDEARFEALAEEFEGLMQDANEHMINGQTNAALKILNTVLSDTQFEPLGRQGLVFEQIMRILLSAERRTEAQKLVFDTAQANEELGFAGLELLYSDIRDTQTPEKLLEWLTGLADAKLPPPLLGKVREWQVFTAFELNQDDQAIAVLSSIMKASPTVIQLPSRCVSLLFDGKRYDTLGKLIAALDKTAKATKSAPLSYLALGTRTRLAAAKADWTAYKNFATEAIATFPDPQLNTLFYQTFPQANKAGQNTLVNDLCKAAITTQPGKKNAVRYAAQLWGKDAQQNAPGQFPGRLETMINAGINPETAFDVLSSFFYATSEAPDLGVLKKVLELGGQLQPKLDSETYASTVALCLLDINFTLNDFDGAITRLETGIPGKAESWHKMAIAKVKAHRAMVNKQNKEAADHFLAFMEFLKEDTEEENLVDPVIGMMLPKEAVLARNAKRVADLLAGVDTPRSDKALKDARDYYAAALELARYPETKALIEKEMADLK